MFAKARFRPIVDVLLPSAFDPKSDIRPNKVMTGASPKYLSARA
jgi:hypothetical protein